MKHTHILAAALAAGVLAVGATVAVAAPTGSPSSPAPGPRQPVEHLGISGSMFTVSSGTPSCYGERGTARATLPVPRGALITGLTGYVIDESQTDGVTVALLRHSFDSGTTRFLGLASTTGAPGSTTLNIQPEPAVLLTEPSSVIVQVSQGKSICLKGVEIHFIRNGTAVAAQQPTEARAPEPTATAALPDGSPR